MKDSAYSPRIVSAYDILSTDAVEMDMVIDTRTPAEFEEDHIPGAVNLPVLNTTQRAEIGTQYKHDRFNAKRKGAAFIAQNISGYLLNELAEKPPQWRPLVYCWRGGNRSGAMATIFSRIGWKVLLLEGGYKAYRRQVVDSLNEKISSLSLQVICGVTGSGKTRLLDALAARGHQVLDLEKLAQHRGSLLGSDPISKQPSQKYFESLLLQKLRRFDPSLTVYVESESRKIGQVQIPERLIVAMRSSPCVSLQVSLEDRIRLLCEEYQHFFSAPELLKIQIQKLIPLHGREVCLEWTQRIDRQDWKGLVEDLLLRHYDPSYQRSLDKNYPAARIGPTLKLQGSEIKDYESAAASFSG